MNHGHGPTEGDRKSLFIGLAAVGYSTSPIGVCARIVAETIIQRIVESDTFVFDLTFTGPPDGKLGSSVPGPNVLLEDGYAIHALGHERMIAVFNEDFGSGCDRPCDLRHKP